MTKKTQDEVLLENKKLRQEIDALKKTKASKNIKTAKVSLKKSMDEKFYHTLFEFSPAGIIIEDKNGIILDVNPAWCKLLGYKRQEIIGKKIHLVAHPENKNKVDNNIKNILDGNISKHTVKSIKKDGSICYIQLNERAIILPNGEKGILSICQDMTQETLAGKALKESEERLKTVVDSTGLGFWDMNYITKKVYRSKHWAKMLGYNLSEIKGNLAFWRNRIHPDDKAFVNELIQEFEEGKNDAIEIEHRLKTKDGKWKWILNWGRIVERDKSGKPLRALGTHLDITKRKEAEEELKRSEERYKNLFEYSPESIIIHSKGKILSANRAAVKFAEVKHLSDLIGKPLLKFVHPDYRKLVTKRLKNADNDGIPLELVEEKFITAKGNIRDVEVSAVPFFDKDNKISMVVFRDITDRKSSEEALRESEEKFRSIFDNFSVGTGIVGIDGKFQIVNRRFADIVGYTMDELQTMRNEDLTYPGDAEETKKQMKLIFQRKIDSFNLEKRLIHKNGNIVWVDLTVKPKFDINGNIESVIGVSQNITERKAAEKALRESEERFRTMFIQNRAVMLLVDPSDNQKILDANKSAENFYGYERSQLLKLNMGDINVMGERDRNVLMKKAIKNPQNYFQFKHKLSNGELKDVEVYASPIMQQDKKCMFVIVHDITERKKAEIEITRLAAVVEQAVESIVITDIDGKINYVNESFEKISGYTKSEALGQNPRILKSGRHDKAFYEELWSTILSGNKWQGVIINKRKNGSLYYEKAAIFPVKNENGEILNFTGIMRDITLERKLEQQLQQVQKMEAIGTLSGGIAHDFNNILTVINGHSEIALMNVDESNAVHEDLLSILNAGKRAEKLTNQLLAFSRKQIHELKVIDINQSIKDLDKMIRRLIPEDIKIVSEFPEGLPFIKADPGQIEQVLINLVINARDAINENQDPENKKEIIVKTQLVDLDHIFVNAHPGSQTGPHILLSVKDTGVGITSDVKNRIFEPFFTTKDVDKGTGLGLATVYGIIKQNDGSIYVESKEGQGTLFEIYWPITNESPGKDYIESINQKEYSGKETILFVEDDEDVRSFASVALKSFGYNIIEARNGKNALQIVQSKKQTFDLIITDLIMPEMNGQELATKVYETHPKLKVLFVSGYTFEHLLKDGEIDEGINFLQKPYTIQNILQRIREVLDE